ncbi:hypothetical protein [Polaribacter ponticola]|uniref:DUF2750 domain-containing protein n=1 Tax=Polaribacter ponticola TaxID=2978475 RepID=A0ABT5SBY9_9FLAO|nr:hypothetical protein [Polaribacter sp. MSW5]MDD7915636.1 hypothetical protein [Polaribacter sp. MSW5]
MIEQESCFEIANRQSMVLAIWLNLNMEEEHTAFGVLYDDCMDGQDDNFFFPE